MSAEPAPRSPLTQPERRAKTRAKLLDAAEAALLERGYAALTLADVAGRAGVTTGAVQRHFSTKQGLLLAVFDRAADRHVEATARLRRASTDAPPADRLRDAMLQSWQALDQRRLRLLDELAQAARIEPLLHDAMLDHGRRSSKQISHEFADRLGPEFVDDPHFETALMLISLMFRGLASGSTLSEEGEVEKFISDAAALLARGLGSTSVDQHQT
ncbi:MAG TPA: TetR/AcrR family transcriptional regulator [Mycobacteriales bacterium]|nr:TetR/AcrR family transcriptional regulator [Mycobacteriales bacterium]